MGHFACDSAGSLAKIIYSDGTPGITNTANGSPFYFHDPVWTNFPWRFYRARLP